MGMHIKLSQDIYKALVQHALSAYPLESCGLLAGADDQVRHLYPVDNIRKSPIEYEMDPAQQLTAMLDLEQKGWELIAIYHSHPHGPQVPSATDVAQAYYPEAAYVIISLADQRRPKIRAFSITAGTVTEIPLNLV
jgi:proteasome lid subunit RPN8/RPN11